MMSAMRPSMMVISTRRVADVAQHINYDLRVNRVYARSADPTYRLALRLRSLHSFFRIVMGWFEVRSLPWEAGHRSSRPCRCPHRREGRRAWSRARPAPPAESPAMPIRVASIRRLPDQAGCAPVNSFSTKSATSPGRRICCRGPSGMLREQGRLGLLPQVLSMQVQVRLELPCSARSASPASTGAVRSGRRSSVCRTAHPLSSPNSPSPPRWPSHSGRWSRSAASSAPRPSCTTSILACHWAHQAYPPRSPGPAATWPPSPPWASASAHSSAPPPARSPPSSYASSSCRRPSPRYPNHGGTAFATPCRRAQLSRSRPSNRTLTCSAPPTYTYCCSPTRSWYRWGGILVTLCRAQ